MIKRILSILLLIVCCISLPGLVQAGNEFSCFGFRENTEDSLNDFEELRADGLASAILELQNPSRTLLNYYLENWSALLEELGQEFNRKSLEDYDRLREELQESFSGRHLTALLLSEVAIREHFYAGKKHNIIVGNIYDTDNVDSGYRVTAFYSGIDTYNALPYTGHTNAIIRGAVSKRVKEIPTIKAIRGPTDSECSLTRFNSSSNNSNRNLEVELIPFYKRVNEVVSSLMERSLIQSHLLAQTAAVMGRNYVRLYELYFTAWVIQNVSDYRGKSYAGALQSLDNKISFKSVYCSINKKLMNEFREMIENGSASQDRIHCHPIYPIIRYVMSKDNPNADLLLLFCGINLKKRKSLSIIKTCPAAMLSLDMIRKLSEMISHQ